MPSGATVICAVGRLSEQKNFGQLLDAIASLDRNDWVLLLVGEGEQLELLQAQAVALSLVGSIRFLGRRSDVALLMQSSDLLAISSRWEGFPYIVIEALANQLPIVATDVGGIREAVIDGQTGWLVPPDDTQALAAALDRSMSDADARRYRGQNGRRLYEDRFDIAAMLAAIDMEFAVVLGNGFE